MNKLPCVVCAPYYGHGRSIQHCTHTDADSVCAHNMHDMWTVALMIGINYYPIYVSFVRNGHSMKWSFHQFQAESIKEQLCHTATNFAYLRVRLYRAMIRWSHARTVFFYLNNVFSFFAKISKEQILIFPQSSVILAANCSDVMERKFWCREQIATKNYKKKIGECVCWQYWGFFHTLFSLFVI